MVVVGGGFAGLAAAKTLRRADVEVTVLDRTNHFLFQPLLYQVATGALAPTDITAPIRWLLRKQRNAQVLFANVRHIDIDRQEVHIDDDDRVIGYDYLIVATGARHSYFGNPAWEPVAPGLKSIEDARVIRSRFLMAFEEAEKCDVEADRRSWLTFIVVGGGPTGVELAGLMPDIAIKSLRSDFRNIDTASIRVVLLEGGARVLPSFPEALSQRAAEDLRALRVEVRTGALVSGIDYGGVHVGDEHIPARTVFWAAGNAASPLGRDLEVPLDRAGRVVVTDDLSVPGHPEVLVAGDLAAAALAEGGFVPGVAPAATQMGRAAAANVLRSIRGEPRRAFRYFDKGNLATIGRYRAVADFGRVRFAGPLAWWLWLFVHILYLAGFRNRLSVLLQWAYSFIYSQRGARLITEQEGIVEGARRARCRDASAAVAGDPDREVSTTLAPAHSSIEER
ncbi:MAG: NAD(P)/FAD-dependent oxidoreductase [Gemmatimonadaceae bacterium]